MLYPNPEDYSDAIDTLDVMLEAEMERLLDRRIQKRLAHDYAYKRAENAEAQAEREIEIERQEIARLVYEVRMRKQENG